MRSSSSFFTASLAVVVIGAAMSPAAGQTNKHYLVHRQPLTQSRFVRLPFGSVKPEGPSHPHADDEVGRADGHVPADR